MRRSATLSINAQKEGGTPKKPFGLRPCSYAIQSTDGEHVHRPLVCGAKMQWEDDWRTLSSRHEDGIGQTNTETRMPSLMSWQMGFSLDVVVGSRTDQVLRATADARVHWRMGARIAL